VTWGQNIVISFRVYRAKFSSPHRHTHSPNVTALAGIRKRRLKSRGKSSLLSGSGRVDLVTLRGRARSLRGNRLVGAAPPIGSRRYNDRYRDHSENGLREEGERKVRDVTCSNHHPGNGDDGNRELYRGDPRARSASSRMKPAADGRTVGLDADEFGCKGHATKAIPGPGGDRRESSGDDQRHKRCDFGELEGDDLQGPTDLAELGLQVGSAFVQLGESAI